jgi:predicted transcriptional regulator YdeE
MNKVELGEIILVGLPLPTKTTNANGQSYIDCGNLWQQFLNDNYADKIPGKLSEEILAVYHQYEGDHTQPFSYFIGCKVKDGAEVPPGLQRLIIPAATYEKITSKGQMPDCIAASWRNIWKSGIPRAYETDFEVYDERSSDWSNAEVDIFLSIKE